MASPLPWCLGPDAPTAAVTLVRRWCRCRRVRSQVVVSVALAEELSRLRAEAHEAKVLLETERRQRRAEDGATFSQVHGEGRSRASLRAAPRGGGGGGGGG